MKEYQVVKTVKCDGTKHPIVDCNENVGTVWYDMQNLNNAYYKATRYNDKHDCICRCAVREKIQ